VVVGRSGGDDFEEWYRAFWPKLVGAVTVAVGDRELAADASAEALSRLWSRSGSPTVEHREGWCYRTAINVARRTARRRSTEARLLRRSNPTLSYTPADADPELWRAVHDLPARQREVIALRYVVDLTQAQIADWLGISPGAAASALHDARAALASKLAGPDPDASTIDDDLRERTDG
jgi:RNA polymerase sigma factor (sigma-70 family)